MLLRETTRIERIAVLTCRLVQGQAVATRDLAQEMGVSRRTIQRDFADISRVLPIYPDNGRWLYLNEETAVAEVVSISPY